MDQAFFGFREPPFNPAPDPRFLHATPSHQEALAQLLFGVQQRKGFILLTGEVGTGKTTLVHALLAQLDDATAVAYVPNAMLDFDGIMEYTLEDLDIDVPPDASAAHRLIALQRFLAQRHRNGLNTVLVLDEAQDLAPRVLEQIRLLSNFEAASEKILQIVLVGQPELRDKLDLPELRQLKQRIGLRCALAPIAPDDVGQYIRTRLRVAGGQDMGMFDPHAAAAIARHSQGIPRVVNMVCDHSLTFAYAEQTRHIGPAIVNEAIRYLDHGGVPAGSATRTSRLRRMKLLHWVVLGVSTAAAGLAALGFGHFDAIWPSLSHLAGTARALLSL